MLYHSLIFPHLIYAADISHLDRILILQKRIVRMLTYSDKRQDDFSFPSANPLFFRLEIIKIHDLFKLKIAKLFKKTYSHKFSYLVQFDLPTT